jgi:hypothetical protein
VHSHGPRLGGRALQGVDDADGDAEAGQLTGRGQADRTGQAALRAAFAAEDDDPV